MHKAQINDQLQAAEDHWVTDLGAWFAGERVVLRGKDLFTELFDRSWLSIWMLSVMGRDLPQKQIDFWGRMWVLCSSFPEPRLWNNRVGALSGSARSTAALAVGSATAVSEAKSYGRQADVGAFAFIAKAQKLVASGLPLAQVLEQELKVKHQVPPGFGRPITKVDERISPVRRLAEEYGFNDGVHYQLALAMNQWFVEHRYRFRLNIGGLAAAFAVDHGFTRREYNMMLTLVFSAGIVACYGDAVQQSPGTFFPLRCERIAYEGASVRRWGARGVG